jgi:pyruvate,water dikinase
MSRWNQIIRRSRRKRENVDSLRLKIEKFRSLLDQNNRMLELIADAGESLGGDLLFDSQYLRWLADQLEESCRRVILDLNFITNNRYLSLMEAFERTKAAVRNALETRLTVPNTPYILPLDQIARDLSDAVGEKMARLGEIRSRLRYETPDGFVITSRACKKFFDEIGVSDKVHEVMEAFEEAGLTDGEAEEDLAGLILDSPLPKDIVRSIRKAALSIEKQSRKSPLFAIRSSAIGEDGQLSFAGLHDSFLGVKASDLLEFYKRVLASLFNARALAYRRAKGEPLQSALMAVGCLLMVSAKAGGVLYTLDPNATDRDVLIVSAAPGLGKTVVEGSGNTDRFVVSRTSPYRVMLRDVTEKENMYEVDPTGGIRLVPMPVGRRTSPAVSESFLSELSRRALRIEQYMKSSLDIEWAESSDGQPIILQARPLQIRTDATKINQQAQEAVRRHKVLISNRGTIGCRGIGYGLAVVLAGDERSKPLPENVVLIAHHSSPQLAELVPSANAVITDVGPSTGHLATITREFNVPSIVDVGIATRILKDGMEITVDAEENVIYEGKVEELLRYQVLRSSSFSEFREFHILRRMLKGISPLNLRDPRARNFTPRNCQTYHDIIRFSHEKAVDYLLDGHYVSPSKDNVYCKHVDMNVPLDLTVIDIGGGLGFESMVEKCALKDIQCEPLRTLLEGLTTPGAWSTEPADMDLGSFMSSAMGPSIITTAQTGRPERNLAIVSRQYMNLNLHLGYHINQIDAYIAKTRNDNYIYFRFVGGMTDITRRSRRARMISLILQKQDFMVEVRGDFVVARLKKFERSTMIEKMKMVGRLIGFTRQMDVLMRDDSLVEKGVDDFIKSIYS